MPRSIQNWKIRVLTPCCGSLAITCAESAIRALRSVRDIPARSLALAMVNPSYETTMPVGRDRQPGPNQVPTPPDFPGPSQTSPDIRAALNSGNRTQHDIVRRNPAAWHAEGQGFESP
jgi:hypothetical protein